MKHDIVDWTAGLSVAVVVFILAISLADVVSKLLHLLAVFKPFTG